MTGTLETVDDRPALRFERRLDHTVERVWRAIVVPAELGRWFVSSVVWTRRLGETITSPDAPGSGQVIELDPPRAIALTWEAQLFRFELQPDGDGCVLVFTHVFDDLALGAAQAGGWEIYLNRLDAHLAGAPITEEEAHRAFPDLHERYRERFAHKP
jgi:uncharacterized protein YndB with AHSA1/START domain